MRLDSLCTYTAENLEFLDSPVHIHVHGVTMNKYKTHVSFVQNVTHMRFFSSRASEFLNQENFHSGKFAPRENNLLYSINCDLILENRPSGHIWYFEKYQF